MTIQTSRSVHFTSFYNRHNDLSSFKNTNPIIYGDFNLHHLDDNRPYQSTIRDDFFDWIDDNNFTIRKHSKFEITQQQSSIQVTGF
ncbi:unnamed protein product [Ambrosiozyma monospora]|uniref:Unnamed protein product n=1 Tax=Ambrosiozyma monospora TaxID=43982 RepID=A0A9W7DND5_AMBMO|nr:unnamed protein product [Ambrosiozyma monospora]